MFKVEIKSADEEELVEVYNDGNIHTLLEKAPFGLLLHCTIKNWNKESKDITHLVLYEICHELHQKGIPNLYALIPPGDMKHKKFIAQYGFQYMTYGEDQEGNGLELWELTTDIGEA